MNQDSLKIIDFEKKGNVVRFYLGNKDCKDYWGDDWNDKPYDCNAGEVYDKFVVSSQDIAFPFGCAVLEPCDGELNCNYSKEDMKARRVPCIIVVPEDMLADQCWMARFCDWVGSENVVKFYFGDSISVLDGDKLKIVKPISECVINLVKQNRNG